MLRFFSQLRVELRPLQLSLYLSGYYAYPQRLSLTICISGLLVVAYLLPGFAECSLGSCHLEMSALAPTHKVLNQGVVPRPLAEPPVIELHL